MILSRRSIAALALLFGLDLLIVVGLTALAGRSQWRETLSGLGAVGGPFPGLVAAWLVAFGVYLSVWAVRHRRGLPRAWLGLLAWGVGGGIVAGLFPEDAPGAAETLSGKLHGIGAGLGSLALLAVPLLVRRGPGSALHRWGPVALSAVAAVAFLAQLAGGAASPLVGLWQRLFLALAYLAVLSALLGEPRRAWSYGSQRQP